MNLRDKFLNSLKRPTNHVIKSYRTVKSTNLSKIKGLFNKNNILNCVENLCSIVKPNIGLSALTQSSNEDWWTKTIDRTLNDSQFLNTFRMQKKTFKIICSMLEDEIKLKGRRHPLDIQKIVTIALYKLTTGSDDKTIGTKFFIDKSKIVDCLIIFMEAVINVMSNEIIFPCEKECIELAGLNQEVSKLPQIIGYLARIRVPLEVNLESTEFKNCKGVSSYVFQGMVDHKFRYI